MSYPRYNNGYVDDGKLVNNHNGIQKCPNCNSTNYRETVSLEECTSCGLRCDYWGAGANDVYYNMMARNHAAEEERWRLERATWNYQVELYDE